MRRRIRRWVRDITAWAVATGAVGGVLWWLSQAAFWAVLGACAVGLAWLGHYVWTQTRGPRGRDL